MSEASRKFGPEEAGLAALTPPTGGADITPPADQTALTPPTGGAEVTPPTDRATVSTGDSRPMSADTRRSPFDASAAAPQVPG